LIVPFFESADTILSNNATSFEPPGDETRRKTTMASRLDTLPTAFDWKDGVGMVMLGVNHLTDYSWGVHVGSQEPHLTLLAE